ncbi:L-lactate dehydrogenase [Candidatus Stoquefichus sp. SB1]|uniref:L-lactate dehydrogenase n=1 Tax=Candidatus Stoquefichus sp. SB1 TaxID=1658109 RepID=UPI00067EC58F|nr:L-lactate dehydrogenase [Candidatus Stoquefichus sp. SB1]
MKENRKVTLIGTGMVGMSMAYSLLNTGGIDELVLIDLDEEKAKGEAMDLNHGIPYSRHKIKVKAGTYKECRDSDIVVICAGANQKEGQTRLELTQINARIMKDISLKVKGSGFQGIVIVASNPVDIMSYVAYKVMGIDKSRVIGSGTLLDTARMRYLLSEYLDVSSDDIEAYILGEHGDSSFISWMNTYVGCKTLIEYVDEKKLDMHDLNDIYNDVKNAAYEIIERKKATYYGIGLSLNKLVLSIFDDTHKILCVSAYLDHEYKHKDIYMGVPCVIGRDGIKEIIELPLNGVDQAKFDESYEILRKVKREVKKDLGL